MTSTSKAKPIQVYELKVLYYTKYRPVKIIVGELDLGREVKRLMTDPQVQYVFIGRYRGDLQ